MDKDVETPEPLDYHLWELYLVGCNERDVTPSLSDFQLWLAEQGYNDSDEVEP